MDGLILFFPRCGGSLSLSLPDITLLLLHTKKHSHFTDVSVHSFLSFFFLFLTLVNGHTTRGGQWQGLGGFGSHRSSTFHPNLSNPNRSFPKKKSGFLGLDRATVFISTPTQNSYYSILPKKRKTHSITIIKKD
jgi:hypothetical protein